MQMSKWNKSLTAALGLALLLGSALESSARPRRWDRDIERTRQGQTLDLGYIQIGNGGRGESMYTLEIARNPHIRCNLTHVRFQAPNDSVWLTRAYVEYRQAGPGGQRFEWIDLNEPQPAVHPFRPGRRGPPPGPQGIQLRAGQYSNWLEVDDDQPGFRGGRCIERLTVYGIDTPDFRGPGGHRPGRWDQPANVRVEGFLMMRQPPMPPPPGHGGPGFPPGHGGPGTGPQRPRQLNFSPLGDTGLLSRGRVDVREIQVGVHQGRFDGVKLIAKDDAVTIHRARIYFGNGEYTEVMNVELRENREVYFDFDGTHRRGARDQDRFIQRIVIEASSAVMWGTKGRIVVEGGR
ncbi:MAG TPA: hypothetical protein PLZ57_05325 [Pseudobdellovibrionaceae bacterium]|nr:hypothetical protein [Pseudobdellovibrionaceae bacterium]